MRLKDLPQVMGLGSSGACLLTAKTCETHLPRGWPLPGPLSLGTPGGPEARGYLSSGG